VKIALPIQVVMKKFTAGYTANYEFSIHAPPLAVVLLQSFLQLLVG
jgi:hypothetical protein